MKLIDTSTRATVCEIARTNLPENLADIICGHMEKQGLTETASQNDISLLMNAMDAIDDDHSNEIVRSLILAEIAYTGLANPNDDIKIRTKLLLKICSQLRIGYVGFTYLEKRVLTYK